MKVFLQRILQEIMKKKYLEHHTLGRRFICSIGQATEREFILDWRISSPALLFLNYNTYLSIYECMVYSWYWILIVHKWKEWFEIHEPSIMKLWPREARILKAWTLYNITLTLCCTIFSCTCFFFPQKTCFSRPYCIWKPVVKCL